MVVSKRCKICAVLDAENIPISGEYFGKLLPELIEKISGIDLDPRKANGVLICKSCAVQLVQVDLVIDKLRNSLQRLKKLVKKEKHKTPSKDSTITHDKKSLNASNDDEPENLDEFQTGLFDSQAELDGSKTQDECKPKTSKPKIARRKSVFPDDKPTNNNDISKQNGLQNSVETIQIGSPTNLDKSETQGESKPKTPKPKIARRKSVFLDDKKVTDISISEKSKTDENQDESKTQGETKPKTPKKAVRRKSVFPDGKLVNNDDSSEQNAAIPNDIAKSNTKFKQILHSEVVTPVKKTPAKATKRKPTTPTNGSLNVSTSVFPDDKLVNNDDISENNAATPNTVANTKFKKILDSEVVAPVKKTPAKATKRKPTTNGSSNVSTSVLPDDKLVNNDDIFENNAATPNTVANTKFKKILDSEVVTPVKKTPAKATKRKPTTSTNEPLNVTTSLDTDLVDSTPVKRNKKMSTSVSEEHPINLTIEEQDCNESSAKESKDRVINCIICAKVFHQKSALREHIETSHMGERLKSCPHCSSEFRSQQKYESHVFSEKCKNTNHICQYPKCNKRFKTVHKMELHMHEKHSSQNESETE